MSAITKTTAVTVATLVLATSLTACQAPGTSTESDPTKPAVSAPIPSRTATASADGPVDSGPRQSAEGTVETDASGTPVAYIVVEGDTAWGIEQRLGLDGIAERYNRYLQPGERLSLTPEIALP